MCGCVCILGCVLKRCKLCYVPLLIVSVSIYNNACVVCVCPKVAVLLSFPGGECVMKRESRAFGRIFRNLFSCDRISNIAFTGFGVSSEEWHLIIYTCRRSQIVLASFWPSCPRYNWCLSVITAVSTSIMSKGVIILGKKVLVTEAMMFCTVGHRYIACL